MSWISTLTDFPEFRDGFSAGLWFALIVAGIGAVLALLWRRGRAAGRAFGLVGPAWVLASLAALDGWFGYPGSGTVPAPSDWIPTSLLLGLVVLAAGVELAIHTPNPRAIGVVLAFPGALLIGFAEDFHGLGWVRPLVIVSISVGAPLVADLDRRSARYGLGPLLWLVTVIGVYATVPDTELIRPLVGAAVPLALVGFPLRLGRLGGAGAAASVGLLVWVGAFEGYGRPGSIVGTVAALGIFVAEPLGRMLLRDRVEPLAKSVSERGFVAALIGAHVLLTWYGTRVAGFARTGSGAVVLLLPAVVVALGIGGWLRVDRRRRSTRRRSSRRQAPLPPVDAP